VVVVDLKVAVVVVLADLELLSLVEQKLF